MTDAEVAEEIAERKRAIAQRQAEIQRRMGEIHAEIDGRVSKR